jgi:VIT1/CCC1 family predicted Fe2+/Mn2+ transporter
MLDRQHPCWQKGRQGCQRSGRVKIMDEATRKHVLTYQQNEITESQIYTRLAQTMASPGNREVLERIAADERRHYKVWKSYTQQEVAPNTLQVWKYYLISRIFGFTFGIKLMEQGEEGAQENYKALSAEIPEAETIVQEEHEHEEELINLLDEERLQYMGSVVLGLNDALVELTGALAGLTFALQQTKLVALTGSITGIAAAFSMAASEYLSTKSEESSKNPVKASIYTGIAYILTVVLLILPYLIFEHLYLCLGWVLVTAVLIIGVFNYYISVAKDLNFRERFLEMAGLSLGVAGLSFLAGFFLRSFFGIEI